MAKAKIVAGVDGSEESKAALRWALDEAHLRRAELLCVHAWLYPSVVDPTGLTSPLEVSMLDTLRDDASELLEHVLAEVATEADKDVEISRSVVEGPAASALLAAAKDADLLVVGSRGRGGFTGLLLGSVSQQCAHHASCPVAIVRGRPTG